MLPFSQYHSRAVDVMPIWTVVTTRGKAQTPCTFIKARRQPWAVLLKERAFLLAMALSTDRVILFPSNHDLFAGWDALLKQLLLGYQGGEGQAWSPPHQECILPSVSPGTEPLQDWGLQHKAVPVSHTLTYMRPMGSKCYEYIQPFECLGGMVQA